MITFVTFYMEIPPEVHLMPETARITTPVDFINTMFLSAELFHPGCEKVLLTDARTPFEPLLPEIKLVRIPHLSSSTPILSRLMAQVAYLESVVQSKNFSAFRS